MNSWELWHSANIIVFAMGGALIGTLIISSIWPNKEVGE